MTHQRGHRFWTWFARRYARQSIGDETSYQRKIQHVQDRFPPDAQVLELGCGTGSTALAHAPHVGHILATDFAPGMIEVAEEKRIAAGIDNITFQLAHADTPPGALASFDAVLALNLLHLVHDPVAVLRGCADRLKPGGFVATSSVALADRMPGLRRVRWLLPVYSNFFTDDQHRRHFSDAGLEIELEWLPNPKAATFIIARKPA